MDRVFTNVKKMFSMVLILVYLLAILLLTKIFVLFENK